MRNFWMIVFAGVVLLGAASAGMTRAQGSTSLHDRVSVAPGNGIFAIQAQSTAVASQQAKPSEPAEAARQKQLSDETAKLLQLATELKAAVDKSNKNQMSLEVIRKADDVEKLAHDLKLKMRS